MVVQDPCPVRDVSWGLPTPFPLQPPDKQFTKIVSTYILPAVHEPCTASPEVPLLRAELRTSLAYPEDQREFHLVVTKAHHCQLDVAE